MGISVTSDFKVSRRVRKLCEGQAVKKVLNKGVKAVASDLLRVGMERAPYKTGTLEHSGVLKCCGNGSFYEARVSFSAVNKKGENYAKRMDVDTYRLGKKSIEKASRGASSKFCTHSLKVGTGYLSDTAEKCTEGYKEYLHRIIISKAKEG